MTASNISDISVYKNIYVCVFVTCLKLVIGINDVGACYKRRPFWRPPVVVSMKFESFSTFDGLVAKKNKMSWFIWGGKNGLHRIICPFYIAIPRG